MSAESDAGQPNILVVMSDEHAPMFSSAYGHSFVRTPNMDRLADEGTTFDAAYCNAPLCVPSRLSFLTGQHVSHCEGWDNATPLPTDAMTWPHMLRSLGYEVVLSGKMHLLGPDVLHGFERQLAYDPHGIGDEDDAAARRLGRSSGGLHGIFPWEEGIPPSAQPWRDVQQAGPGTGPMIEADDAIEAAALEYLRGPARQDRPFALCVGFIAPHFPFIVPEPYFSMYHPEHADLPSNPAGHLGNLPAAARRLRQWFDFESYSDEEIGRARAAYYGLITYLDDKIGRLLNALDEQGLAGNTVVVHTSDHGESLGEHGLWRKMNFYEQAARVPLQISWPGVLPRGQRLDGVVSGVDATATILELAGAGPDETGFWDLDGDSLLPLIRGEDATWKDEAFVEHLAHGTDRPRAMVRQGRWKLCYSHGDPPDLELYDLETDPGEFTNLADEPVHAETQARLLARIMELWGDPDELERRIRNGQRTRQVIREVMGAAATF